MQVTRTSILTGETNTREIDVTPEQYERFMQGEAPQRAFPTLPAHEREFLLNGITPEESKKFNLD